MSGDPPPCALCDSPVLVVQKDGPSGDGFPAGPKPTRVCSNLDCSTNGTTKAWVIKP